MENDSKESSANSPKKWETNFFRILCYQTLLRVGWIFKTETVVMPAVLDLVSGAGWVRGFLPIFNRFGQSIPPLLASGWLASRKLKKRVLFSTTFLMSICFGLFAVLFGNRQSFSEFFVVLVFICVYAIFFCCVGLNQTALNTLQGKLIPAIKRGKLLVFSSTIGVAAAVSCALLFLPFLLSKDSDAFHWIFFISASLFFFASLAALWFDEPKDNFPSVNQRFWKQVPDTFRLLKQDRDFCRFLVVAAIFGSSISLLPHYQSLAKQQLEIDLTWLLPWLVAQNVGSALFGSFCGLLADRFGNRFTLKIAMLIQSTIPLFAVVVTMFFSSNPWFYVAVFFLLGNTPIVFRVCNNYTLESTKVQNHPLYLSFQSACIALPCFLLSLPIGILVDSVGFYPVFVGQSVVLNIGFWLTFLIAEPRHKSQAS